MKLSFYICVFCALLLQSPLHATETENTQSGRKLQSGGNKFWMTDIWTRLPELLNNKVWNDLFGGFTNSSTRTIETVPPVISDTPSMMPSDTPSSIPSDMPSSMPSDTPSSIPSDIPSSMPSDAPSMSPIVLEPTTGNEIETETGFNDGDEDADSDMILAAVRNSGSGEDESAASSLTIPLTLGLVACAVVVVLALVLYKVRRLNATAREEAGNVNALEAGLASGAQNQREDGDLVVYLSHQATSDMALAYQMSNIGAPASSGMSSPPAPNTVDF